MHMHEYILCSHCKMSRDWRCEKAVVCSMQQLNERGANKLRVNTEQPVNKPTNQTHFIK